MSDEPLKAEDAKKPWGGMFDVPANLKSLKGMFTLVPLLVGVSLAGFLGGDKGEGLFLTLFFAYLYVAMVLASLRRYSWRGNYRFSLISLLQVTTILCFYSFVIRFGLQYQEAIPFSPFSQILLLCVGDLLGLCLLMLFGNLFFFLTEGWYSYEKGKPEELVETRWHWLPHLVIAFVVAMSFALFDALGFPMGGLPFWFLIGLASRSHRYMMGFPIVALYDNGIELVGKFWRWKDGRLELFTHRDITRLGPTWLGDEPEWKQRLWPVIPEDKIEAIQQVLDEKQPSESNA